MERKIKSKLPIPCILFLLLVNIALVNARSEDKTRAGLIKDLLNADKAITTLSVIGCLDEGRKSGTYLLFGVIFKSCYTSSNIEITSSVIKNTQSLSVSYDKSPLALNQTIETAWAHRKLYVTDFERCPELIQDFLKMDKYFLAHPFHWLTFVTENQISMFRNMSALLASNIVLAFKKEQNKLKVIQGKFSYTTYMYVLYPKGR